MIRFLEFGAIVLLAGFSLVLWQAFLRQVPVEVATGTITEKVYKPEGTYDQHQHGLDRGFRMPVRIPVAEGYILVIRLDQGEGTAGASVNMIQARQFNPGDRVRIHYQVRGIPSIWERFTVLDVQRLEGA